jgi:hypothetical protein
VNAELLAIHHVIKANPIDSKISIYTDSKVNKDLIEEAMKDPPISDIDPTLEDIIKLIHSRSETTEIHHVYSHLLDDVDMPNKDKKMEKMKQLYKDETKNLLTGNRIADEMANKAHQSHLGYGPGTQITKPLRLLYRGIEVNHNFNKHINHIMRKEFEKTEQLTEGKGSKTINKTLFLSQKYEHGGKQDFSFKMTTEKLLLRERATHPDRKEYFMKSDSEKIKKLLESDKCPFGCSDIETLKHLQSCRYTIDIAKDLPRTVLHIVNKYLKIAKVKPISFFPSFYWTHGHNTNYYIRNSVPAFKRLSESNPHLTLQGSVPKEIGNALKEVGMPSKLRNKCASDISIAIIDNMQQRWKKRCKKLYN